MATGTPRLAEEPEKPEDLNAPYFNIRQVAWFMHCSVKTARRRVKEGYPHSRRGKRGPIRVSQDDLSAWYDADRVHTMPIRRTRRAAARPAKSAA